MSSTVSFALVSTLMAMYSYSTASQFLRSLDHPAESSILPNPFQLSLLIRVLNADLLALWDLGCAKVREVFCETRKQEELDIGVARPKTLRLGITVLIGCVACSLFIQAADSYLHIATEAMNMVQINEQAPDNYEFSRALSQSCYDSPTVGSRGNRNFWGCGIDYDPSTDSFLPRNISLISAIDRDKSTELSIYNFRAQDKVNYAVVGPYIIDSTIDWIGFSCAVSTQCAAIPATSCNILWDGDPNADARWGFNCERTQAGFDLSGNVRDWDDQRDYLDFHQYLKASDPFEEMNFVDWLHMPDIAVKITDDKANSMTQNPWYWLSIIPVDTKGLGLSSPYQHDSRLQWNGVSNILFLSCNSTVWDVQFDFLNGEVVRLDRTVSNGSIAAISSIPSAPPFTFLSSIFNAVINDANFNTESPDDIIEAYSRASSRALALPLAAQTSPRPSVFVQKRTSKVIAKVPKSALGVLVAANLLFSMLGFIVAILAIFSTRPEVAQIQTRLSIAGLIAELFQTAYSYEPVDSASAYFHRGSDDEQHMQTRVSLRITDEGGSAYISKRF